MVSDVEKSGASGAAAAPIVGASVGGSGGRPGTDAPTEASDTVQVSKAIPALEAAGVRFAFGRHEVLRGVDLDVPAGTVLFLMGVNGCGKTTFIDCVLGTNRISAGSLRVFGSEVAELSVRELAQRVSFVPQLHRLSFSFAVRDVVLMGRTAHLGGLGVPDERDRDLVEEALKTCRITQLAERPYTALSGGEVQMVLLARALAQQSPLIVLDEPTAHLDFRNELVFLEAVVRLVQEHGLSILMASHTPNQALFLADSGLDVRVAVMQEGRVGRISPPHQALTLEALRSTFGVDAAILEAECEYRGAVRHVAQVALLGLCDDEEDADVSPPL